MKKRLLGIFILMIGISLYFLLNKNDSLALNLEESAMKKEVSNKEVSNKEVSNKEVSNKEVSNKEVSNKEVSKNRIRVANNNESQYYRQQREALKNKNYLDKEEPIYQDNNQIFLNLDGEHKKISLGKDEYFRPNLSPDKTYLSYEDSNGIVIQNITDGSVIKLKDDASDVSWHPNEDSVLYLRTKDDGTVLTESKIYVYDIQNKKETCLTSQENRILVEPIFSEDGNSVYVKDDNTEEILTITVKKTN